MSNDHIIHTLGQYDDPARCLECCLTEIDDALGSALAPVVQCERCAGQGRVCDAPCAECAGKGAP